MKSVLITGCSSGIGEATAYYLKSSGYRVFATARKEADVEKLKHDGFEAFYLDVTKKETISNTLEEILKLTGGTLDVVFNNAGFGQPGAVEDIKTDILRGQFETNVFGLHEVMMQVLPIMKAQGYGKIINHSSVLGLISLKLRGAYNASKYAIEGLSDTLRLELEGTNIAITVLNTGPITSDFRKNAKQKTIENINIENSRFKETYHKSLNSSKSDVPFNLPPIEVAKVVEKIIKAKKVNPRYYITKATYLLGFAKRVLSTRLLDKILIKI
ncbi:MAG: SDR family NAD(P)-dependent oxidoreductase [Arcobacteraceae bacterium]|jgi:short-subunit dehydrogenase|nr:SDR family NAD(P)-dependent oxidoreductase [Arcobacteraceae bacterium]